MGIANFNATIRYQYRSICSLPTFLHTPSSSSFSSTSSFVVEVLFWRLCLAKFTMRLARWLELSAKTIHTAPLSWVRLASKVCHLLSAYAHLLLDASLWAIAEIETHATNGLVRISIEKHFSGSNGLALSGAGAVVANGWIYIKYTLNCNMMAVINFYPCTKSIKMLSIALVCCNFVLSLLVFLFNFTEMRFENLWYFDGFYYFYVVFFIGFWMSLRFINFFCFKYLNFLQSRFKPFLINYLSH